VSVPDNDIVFTAFGGNNYPQLAQQRLGEQKGRAFVTEYAGAANRFSISDPALRALLSQYPYLTRVYTRISPEDMTIDPVFRFNASLPDVSNVHDLSKDPNRVWDCDKMTNTVTNPVVATASRATDNFNPVVTAIYAAGACIALALVFVGFGLVVSRRRA